MITTTDRKLAIGQGTTCPKLKFKIVSVEKDCFYCKYFLTVKKDVITNNITVGCNHEWRL